MHVEAKTKKRRKEEDVKKKKPLKQLQRGNIGSCNLTSARSILCSDGVAQGSPPKNKTLS